MASEPLFVGSSSRHFDLRLYDALWLIRSTNDHRPESFLFFIFCALLASQGPPWREESADDSTCKTGYHWSRYLVEMNVRPNDTISCKKRQEIH